MRTAFHSSIALALTLPSLVLGLSLDQLGFQTNIESYGPDITVEYLFDKYAPTGITVSSKGRKFINVNRPSNYTVIELVDGKDVPYPDAKMNTPPSLFNTSIPDFGASYPDYFLNVQAVIVDGKDRLWVLDTGRPTVNGKWLFNNGGGKLVGIDLATDKVFKTIVFPLNVAYQNTFLNDIRFDLRKDITASGEGIAYITDSSTDGRSGFIVVDLGTGQSWRHLDQHPSVIPDQMMTTSYNGNVFMPLPVATGVYSSWTYGLNAIAISPDGEYLFYGPLSSRRWYRVSTKVLRQPTIGEGAKSTAGIDAKCEANHMGWLPSHLDGIESDASGNVYLTAPETNSIYVYNPARGLVEPFLRHGAIQWPDTLSVADDGKLYFTVNQLWLAPGYNNGTDHRKPPYALLSVPALGKPIKLV